MRFKDGQVFETRVLGSKNKALRRLNMNQQKLKRVIYCLYVICGIKAITVVYYFSKMIDVAKFDQALMMQVAGPSMFAGLLWPIGGAILTYFVARDLKLEKSWAWIGGLTLSVISIPSFALPAAVLALVTLLDVEIRTPFIKELDIKL
jgi:hypothetical protein